MDQIDRDYLDNNYVDWLSKLGKGDFGVFHDVCKYLQHKIPIKGNDQITLDSLEISLDKNFQKQHKDWVGTVDLSWVVDKLEWTGFVLGVTNREPFDIYTVNIDQEKIEYLLELIDSEKQSRNSNKGKGNVWFEGQVCNIKLDDLRTKQITFDTKEDKNQQFEVFKLLVESWKNNQSLPKDKIDSIFTSEDNSFTGSHSNDIIGNLRKTLKRQGFENLVVVLFDKNSSGYTLSIRWK